MDYGEEQAFQNSLRGIHKHKYVNEKEMLRRPGEVDLSAYVNFSAIREVARKEQLHVGDLMPQGFFLESMGISLRIDVLKKNMTAAQRKRIESEYERLASPKQMGAIYKMLYASHSSIGEVFPFLGEDTLRKKEFT